MIERACLLPALSALAQTICSSVYLRDFGAGGGGGGERGKKGLCLCVQTSFVCFLFFFSASVSSCVSIGAAHAKAHTGSGVD